MKGWYKIYATRNYAEANIIKGMLEENNVNVVILNKLDSSYLTGNFTYIDRQSLNTANREFLCDSTLIRMRNEILAEYGFIFPDEQTTEHFKFYNWYQPRFESVEEIEEGFTDIDGHNLRFLEKIIGPIPKKESI